MAKLSKQEDLVWRLENRLAEQAKSIGRLLEHLSLHHDELGQITAEQCTWLQREWAKSNAIKEEPTNVA